MTETEALAEGAQAGTVRWAVAKAQVLARSGKSSQPCRGPTKKCCGSESLEVPVRPVQGPSILLALFALCAPGLGSNFLDR